MIRAVRTLLGVFLLVGAPVAAQQRIPPCGETNPRIGRLDIVRGPMRLARSESERDVSASIIDLCANDRVRTLRGEAVAHVGRSSDRLVPGRIYTYLPYRGRSAALAFMTNELTAQFGNLVSVARRRLSASHGAGDLQFQVAGLDNGAARLGSGTRALQLRFLGNGRNFRASLIGPGQTLPGTIADDPPSRLWRVVFPEAHFQAGERWRISIAGDFGALEGSFTVVEGPIVIPAEANGLPDDDQAVLGALLLASDDVEGWSFEAFQWLSGRPSRRFGEEDAEYLLWHWAEDPWAVPQAPRPAEN